MSETSILYVDDEPDHADILKLALRGRGYSVTHSIDAASALQLLRSGYRPELVIADWAMPGMSGTELLAILKKTYPSLPVILVSGQASFGDADEMLHLRPDALLSKPVDWTRRLGTIERVLAQHRAGGVGERPQVFIGCTSRALHVAEAVQLGLVGITEPVLWTQGVFELGGGTLEELLQKLPSFDFAVFVVTQSDYEQASVGGQVSRDNVFIETGIALGILGRRRTWIVVEASAHDRLPSDLAGITVAMFDGKQQNLRAAVGPAVAQIKDAAGKHGKRTAASSVG